MTGAPGPTIVFPDFYEERFVRRCHELLSLGYRRLAPKSLTSLDETAITGHLCDAMEAALDATDRPDWATQFTTADDQPESVRGRTGKRGHARTSAFGVSTRAPPSDSASRPNG